ncbi:helix-turn-helix domain-containing protein [Mycolicibacterium sp. BiH015]|uniref:helix-turn-helix domain-containing protein n=1 Tax=Mycolicibacterium sp. BiH015 TaxID=3018808 RepID=UPI0022E2271D|nr:helix-turn-helix domain-containing protein [Mycolicibacterium sp. BiH015]MDA2893434.1 helix-turn-helix domain-containing protein [Mycolicibacterium sp. BiH015]
MKDAFHGSARLPHGLHAAHRELADVIVRPYHGSSRLLRRRGTAHTAPVWIRRASGHCFDRLPRIALGVDVRWAAIPCWSGRARRWAHETVPAAYRQRYDSHVRPVMPNNPVSLKSVVAVAEARASFADHRTGRNCRPTNERIAKLTGLSVRTVQRASTALRLLGVATEVMRGRQRTRAERYASWRVGDRGRGWASVWALHDSRIQLLSPHPEGSLLDAKTSCKTSLTTGPRPKAGRSVASRRTAQNPQALTLANRWICDQQSPPWARRYRTGTPWARVLAKVAEHGWTPRDINQAITDWIGTGHWIPETPHKPIGLLGAILAAHGNPAERPSALEEAREAAEVALSRKRIAAQLAERDAARRALEAGRAALSGSGRQAALQIARDAAHRAQQRRADADRFAYAELRHRVEEIRGTTGDPA